MAFSMGKLHHFINIALVLALLSFIYSTASSPPKTQAKAATDYAHLICPKTRNPTFCFKAMGSFKNLNDVAHDMIILAFYYAGIAEAEFRESIAFEKNPELLQRYKACDSLYDRAVDYLAQGKRLLESGSYKAMPVKASAAIAEEEACDRVFATPPPLDESIRDETRGSQDAASIVLVVSQMLAAGVH